jgi:hypothetical protein
MTDGSEDRIWTPRLLGLANSRLDIWLTLAALAVLAASRFLLLANGPWEQDEAIFARSILRFDPAHHSPHAPFFPGWIAIGMALTPIVGEPLLALQFVSSLASVLCVFPLAYIGRKVAPPAVAFACAVGVGFLPGSWVFAVRGFNSIAAAMLIFVALAWATRGVANREAVPFGLLAAAAVLVRPVLVPFAGVVWAVGIWPVRPRWRMALSAAVAAVAVVAGNIPVVLAVGGWQKLFEASGRHYAGHVVSVAASSWRFADLGPVTALGGPVATVVIGVFCAIGAAVWWRRRGWRSAVYAGILVAGFVAFVVVAHVRTFPRYSAPLALGVAPLVAAALALVPRASVAAALAAAGAAAAAVIWFPAVRDQHRDQLPLWRASWWACERSFASPGEWRTLAGDEAWVFVDYADLKLRSRHPEAGVLEPQRWLRRMPRPVEAPHWYIVSSQQINLLPWQETREEVVFSGVSPRLVPLTQRRFLSGRVISDLPLQRGSWWAPEKDGSKRVFSWCSSRSSLMLPATEAGESLILPVRAARGALPLKVDINRKLTFTVAGAGALEIHRIPSEALYTDRENTISLDREQVYPPSERDQRPLAAAVYVVTSAKVSGTAVSFGDADRLQALGVTLQGFFGRESFRDGVVGRWSQPVATIAMPAVAGTFVLTLLAPRPPEARAEVWVEGTMVGGPWVVPTVPRSYEVVVPAALSRGATLRLELRVSPYTTPALPKRSPRSLGVVVSSMTIPSAPGPESSNLPAALHP